jgi:hypothetical protein
MESLTETLERIPTDNGNNSVSLPTSLAPAAFSLAYLIQPRCLSLITAKGKMIAICNYIIKHYAMKAYGGVVI